MIKQFNWRGIAATFIACMRDERGVAMTEYLIVNMYVTLPAAFYLYYPDNGFYWAARNQYNLTTLLLLFPGP
jgi:hypothetical protein